ncbi:Protein GrpE [Candidatus Entotheonellaceae bacterium PAL068K]
MATHDQQPVSDEPLTDQEAAVADQDNGTMGDRVAEPVDDTETETASEIEDLSIEALQEQLTEQRRQTEEYVDYLQRLQAEFVNYKRRASQEQLRAASRGKEEVLQALLPVLGNFRLAVQHAAEDANTVRQGVQMIWQQFESFLRGQSVERVETVGQPFDPTKHEALSMAPATEDHPANTVIAEINAGYVVDGRLLQPAQVVVARAKEPMGAAESDTSSAATEVEEAPDPSETAP